VEEEMGDGTVVSRGVHGLEDEEEGIAVGGVEEMLEVV